MRCVDKFVQVTSMVLMGTLVIITFFQVVNRSLFHLPVEWTEEMARFISVWMSLMGTALCLKEGSHIEVDIVYSLMGKRVQKILSSIIAIVCLFFCFIVIWQGTIILDVIKFQKAPASGINMVLVYAAGPVCMLITAIYIVEQLYNSFKK
jgi:TRAP-type C4-dicarboxylate transport system permease small subunit